MMKIGEKSVAFPLCPSRMSRDITRDRTQGCMNWYQHLSIIARHLICYPIMGLTVPCEALQGRVGLGGCCSDDREYVRPVFYHIFNP